jgi:hypothetical protein
MFHIPRVNPFRYSETSFLNCAYVSCGTDELETKSKSRVVKDKNWNGMDPFRNSCSCSTVMLILLRPWLKTGKVRSVDPVQLRLPGNLPRLLRAIPPVRLEREICQPRVA